LDAQAQQVVPNSGQEQLAALINEYADDPYGVQIVAWSGGASTTAGAIDSGMVNQQALQNITSIDYLSPGFGIGALGPVAPPNGTVSYAHGSGLADFAVTFRARVTGQAGARQYAGHSSLNAINSQYFQDNIYYRNGVVGNLRLTPCTHGQGGGGGGPAGSMPDYSVMSFTVLAIVGTLDLGVGDGIGVPISDFIILYDLISTPTNPTGRALLVY